MKSNLQIAVNNDLDRTAPVTADPVIFYGVFGLLLLGPLAFGGVEPWSIFILETGVAILFLLWAVRQIKSGELYVAGNPVFLPMLAFGGLVALQLFTGLSAYRQATLHAGLLYCAYGTLCFLAVQSLRKSSQISFLAGAFSVYGFCLAVFALFQALASNGKIYWARTPSDGGWIYGPYVNHNHYAGLMEMLLPIPLVIALSHFVDKRRRTLAAVAAAIMASTIFLSGSRGGMLAFAVQMAVLTAFLVKRKKGRTVALALGAFLIVVVGLVVWIGGGELANRMASIQSEARTEVAGGTRTQIVRDGLRMFVAYPLLGSGLGNFPEVYPQYRSFFTNLYVNQAHNDYLQLLVEMGALGFAVMIWFVLVVYSRAAKKLGNWPDDINGALALSAVLGCTGILVHSFVDFNLQIPANAALFYVLCAIAAFEPRFAWSRRSRSER